jgi:hypothetical protein
MITFWYLVTHFEYVNSQHMFYYNYFSHCQHCSFHHLTWEPSWSWSYGSWIYNYLCNQCLSLLTMWFQIPLRRGVLDATLCDTVCQWLTAGRWFSLYNIMWYSLSVTYGRSVVFSIQQYVIQFVSDLRQVGGFLQLLRFLSTIKLTATI